MSVIPCPLCAAEMDLSSLPPGTQFSCPACGAVLSQNPETGQLKVHGGLAACETVQEGSNEAWKMAVAQVQNELAEDSIVELRPVGDGSSGESDAQPAIAGYEILERVGEGGMATVYRARQLSLQREVALKFLSKDLASSDEFVKRFDKEARALGNLSHPNIVTCFDKGCDGGHYFLSMEFIHGRSLRAEMEEGRLSPDRVLEIVSDVCQALAYTHEHGVIHRDVKPENVLLTREGKVKVTDFGLAAMAGEGSVSDNLTRANVMMGTVNYMPPEQRVDAKAVDHRADLYAVGVLFYEMLTGKLPMGSVQMPGEMDSSLDPRIDDLLHRMLKQDPADRIASAAQVVEEIAVIRSLPSPVPGATKVPETPRALPAMAGQERAESDIADLVAQAQRDMKRQRTKGLPTQIKIVAPPKGRSRGLMWVLCFLLFGGVGLGLVAWKEPLVALWVMADTKERLFGSWLGAEGFRPVEEFVVRRFHQGRKRYAPVIKAAMKGTAITPRVGAIRLLSRSGLKSWKWLLPLLRDEQIRIRREAGLALLRLEPEGGADELARLATGAEGKIAGELRYLEKALRRVHED